MKNSGDRVKNRNDDQYVGQSDVQLPENECAAACDSEGGTYVGKAKRGRKLSFGKEQQDSNNRYSDQQNVQPVVRQSPRWIGPGDQPTAEFVEFGGRWWIRYAPAESKHCNYQNGKTSPEVNTKSNRRGRVQHI